MALRDIIVIDEEKCTGCGKCVNACAEGALQMVNGKAKLVRDDYCDGLGACIGSCPYGALTIEKREAPEFDMKAVEEYLKESNAGPGQNAGSEFVCPGAASFDLVTDGSAAEAAKSPTEEVPSALGNWPVQLALIPPTAPYLKNADLLVAADCVPFAMPDFHSKYLSGRKLVVGCPKLDNVEPYIEKLAQMIKGGLNSITLLHMQVPCCSKLVRVLEKAIEISGEDIGFTDITISLKGEVLSTEEK
ncbi:Ferredoxin II [Limihaloglobus sulfuriphilus]|uniref:Ferredoxin II n=1 Tax=Limihaloglobus sulfuriphilus TaxID=1851148 RepID=A0A1Q2MDS7_9BACT|nr:4Fe-4S binding protein [Limihaloglobus sulfuriphilus]AQQ70851.1 Ferredoxin II [Limihaloglobus sulfuriphilus]